MLIFFSFRLLTRRSCRTRRGGTGVTGFWRGTPLHLFILTSDSAVARCLKSNWRRFCAQWHLVPPRNPRSTSKKAQQSQQFNTNSKPKSKGVAAPSNALTSSRGPQQHVLSVAKQGRGTGAIKAPSERIASVAQVWHHSAASPHFRPPLACGPSSIHEAWVIGCEVEAFLQPRAAIFCPVSSSERSLIVPSVL